MRVQDQILELIRQAAAGAQAAGSLPAFDLPALDLARPRSLEHGDFASNIALKSAKAARMKPLDIAEAVAAQVPTDGIVSEVGVAPPGFINLRLSEAWLADQVDRIRAAGASFADLDIGQGQRAQVEYVSANPTGPLHFGGARNAAIGDTLARALEAAGYEVQREYYLNDSGTQMGLFGKTLLARYRQALGEPWALPDDGYQGDYMKDYAQRVVQAHGRAFLEMDEDEAAAQLGEIGLKMVIDYLEEVLGQLDVRFDRWFSERSLYEDGHWDAVFADLQARGLTDEREGAVWLRTSEFGSDRDEVIVRSSGQPGYYASDVAYHHDKFVRRGFDRVIDVWAVDHQNQARRMPQLMQALGLDPERLDIVIYDLVKLVKDGQEVKMSKRAGTFVSLDDVLEEIDADAVRFLLLTRSNEQVIEFDLGLAAEQSSENPVYYVQYAHARICSILRKAEADGFGDYESGDVRLLTEAQELALVREMLRLPDVIDMVVQNLAPHHFPHYAQDLAKSFHTFYHHCQVIDADAPELSRARLKLVDATRIALARALDLMGMSAPEEM